ncbi:DUF551 domain-containing protein [Acinetobacter johnsonii]|uniref:DUF551 domain-containing protein n=2 Tax=Acinetobacter johnsonii TaxID=40214 RepID=A0A3R9F3T2_ACIJO|nr:DUF551 domain-containing protein [Acinetobacter johnsonii]
MSPSDGCFELEDDGFYESLETHRLWVLWQLKTKAQAVSEGFEQAYSEIFSPIIKRPYPRLENGDYKHIEIDQGLKLWRAATAQAAPEWISVNDKMPDEGDEVFVHHYGHIVQATKDQKYSGGFKQRNCYGWEAVSSYISHWMPMSVVLPESYHFYYGKPAKKAQEQSHV